MDAAQDSGSDKTATSATNADITSHPGCKRSDPVTKMCSQPRHTKNSHTGWVQLSLLPAMLVNKS